MTQITTYTTTEEVAAIYDDAAYKNADGSINYDAIAQDILDGDSITTANPHGYNREDLLTAYVSGKGELPSFMMAPASTIPDPDADSVETLWDEPMVSSLHQLGDTMVHSDAYNNAVRDFLAHGGVSGPISESEAFINGIMSMTGTDHEQADKVGKEVMDLFNVNNLTEVMHMFMAMGNPGIALLLYTAYGLNPAMRDLQEAALGVMDELSSQQDELLGKIQDLSDSATDTPDPSAQYDSQVISQQLDVIKTVLQTMTQFMQNAQDAIKQTSEMASNLSEELSRTIDSIIRNIS